MPLESEDPSPKLKKNTEVCATHQCLRSSEFKIEAEGYIVILQEQSLLAQS